MIRFGHDDKRPARIAWLTAVEGLAVRKKLPEIAVEVYGANTVADSGLDSDSDLRARARRLVSKARWLMKGGYLELAAGPALWLPWVSLSTANPRSEPPFRQRVQRGQAGSPTDVFAAVGLPPLRADAHPLAKALALAALLRSVSWQCERKTLGAEVRLATAGAGVTRLRLGLEGTWRGIETGDGWTLTLEVGVRHDDGDAETGLGLEAGTGLGPRPVADAHPDPGRVGLGRREHAVPGRRADEARREPRHRCSRPAPLRGAVRLRDRRVRRPAHDDAGAGHRPLGRKP